MGKKAISRNEADRMWVKQDPEASTPKYFVRRFLGAGGPNDPRSKQGRAQDQSNASDTKSGSTVASKKGRSEEDKSTKSSKSKKSKKWKELKKSKHSKKSGKSKRSDRSDEEDELHDD